MVCDAQTWDRLGKAAASRARELGINLQLRGSRSIDTPGEEREKQTYLCRHPWMSSVVTIDGEVMPCCNIHNPAFSMGNIFRERFHDVWNGARYRQFRMELRQRGNVPVACRWCPDF